MKRPIILLASVSVTLCVVATSAAQGWRGIRPLHSTREDVERLIGPPMEPKGITYDLKNARVNVVYSDGHCANGWPYGWNVKPGTVLGITIYPQQTSKLGDLPIDLSKFAKYVDPSGFIHFNNNEEGISVEVDPNDYDVRAILYFPAISNAHLRCPEAAERERQIAKGESEVRWPDAYYSDTSPEKRHVYLDYFADQLNKAQSRSTVYIIAYAGQQARVGEAQTRANWAKDYLTRKRGIAPSRIVTIDGGHREIASVDLFIVEPGQPKPLSSPNVYPGNVRIIQNNVGSKHRRSLRQITH